MIYLYCSFFKSNMLHVSRNNTHHILWPHSEGLTLYILYYNDCRYCINSLTLWKNFCIRRGNVRSFLLHYGSRSWILHVWIWCRCLRTQKENKWRIKGLTVAKWINLIWINRSVVVCWYLSRWEKLTLSSRS